MGRESYIFCVTLRTVLLVHYNLTAIEMLRLRFAPLSMTGAGTPVPSVMLSEAKYLIPKGSMWNISS